MAAWAERLLDPRRGLLRDGASSWTTLPSTRKRSPPLSAGTGPELVTLGTNVGPAAARNAGLSRVTTCYVGFVDSDVEVSASDLLELTRHFADPEVVVVEPRVVGLSRSSRPRWFERYDEAASSLTLGSVPARVQPGGTVAWLPSACLVARTDRIDSAFDPDLRVGEDVDFVWRVNDAGGLVRYEPAVTARHDTRSTLRGWLGRKAFYGSGSAVLALRHGERLAPAVLSPAYALAAAALLMRLRWSPVLAGLAVASSTRSVRRALPDCEGRTAVASRIALRGLGWSVRQEAASLLRHWWPVAAGGALVSAHVRRAVVSALLVDAVLAAADQPAATSGGLSPAAFLAGRRLDDLAYGAGLWWGAIRIRSGRALLPRRPRRP
jgi:mycofactocin system glycosyltransferase